ncbi:hypothetical protein LVB87_03295 [Lysobacter sp. KIS68-7]|uniref:hypothetical protein n=1 Tax=Lysobacter sp. KIS68-7 TaxID=2904252 RepID=UPI001E2C1D74|nr:hypothetical protein [Lysobacter sp. KIS68-7]UHQ20202.1 hypothetical protein LVB87_03295 [Lysobacter sp. KIS68-7]
MEPRLETPAPKATQLLWTGGWDSTFRLLQLLLVNKVPVVPHYLRDPTRKSTSIELATMERIVDLLHARHPHTRNLLLPLRSVSLSEIPSDHVISGALRSVRERVYIGSQYEWLSAYCKHNGIQRMELCVHVDDKVHIVLAPFTAKFQEPGSEVEIRADPRFATTAEFALFRYFSFPLFEVEKVEMGHIAEANGWNQVMEMTWFCHSPVNDKPCGVCGPCVYTIQEGLGRRIPMSRRVLSFFYRLVGLPFKSVARRLLRER